MKFEFERQVVAVKIPKSIYLLNWQNLPRSINTLYQAQLLILLSKEQPTTSQHFDDEYGFSKNNVRKCFRSFILDDLVEENYQLYKLTSTGVRIVQELLKDSMLVDWYQSITNFVVGGRPVVHRFE